MILAAAWALATLAAVWVVWISRRCLLRPASHGFWRLWAFLAILALVPPALPHWFEDPLAPRQVLSWLLLCGSIVPVALGTTALRRRGRPTAPAADSGLFAFEQTSVLVADGIYRFIRHPMYASLLYLAWGVALKAISTRSLVLALAATGALVATARAEEREDIARFGAAYRVYMSRTRRFVPFIL
jgi:protein-S-isoprenylcysteine O-methyltransferase Ste14